MSSPPIAHLEIRKVTSQKISSSHNDAISPSLTSHDFIRLEVMSSKL